MRPECLRPPVTLRGRWVELEPLTMDARDDLLAAAHDPESLRLLGTSPGRTREEVGRYIATLLERQAAGTDLPFVIRRRPERRAVGGCRYLHIDRENDSAEIGTWLDPTVWRTPVNTEVKFLLLGHAFESEGVHRIALMTDLRNERSQRAIVRIGATREGVLREDRRTPDGYRRSSVVYSIVADEWPTVRRRLETALARPWSGPASPPG